MKHSARNLANTHFLTFPQYVSPEQWQDRHTLAWQAPRPGGELAIVMLITALAILVDAHYNDIAIGQDGYYHEHATDLVTACRAYLNFDCGRLDCGTLDRLILEIARLGQIEVPE